MLSFLINECKYITSADSWYVKLLIFYRKKKKETPFSRNKIEIRDEIIVTIEKYTRYTRIRGDRDEFCRLTVCPPCLSSSRRWCRLSRFSNRQALWRGLAGSCGPCRRALGCIVTRVCWKLRRLSPSIGATSRNCTGFLRVIHSVRTIIRNCKLSGSRLIT